MTWYDAATCRNQRSVGNRLTSVSAYTITGGLFLPTPCAPELCTVSGVDDVPLATTLAFRVAPTGVYLARLRSGASEVVVRLIRAR